MVIKLQDLDLEVKQQFRSPRFIDDHSVAQKIDMMIMYCYGLKRKRLWLGNQAVLHIENKDLN